MASTRSTISRPPRKVFATGEVPSPTFGDVTPTEPKLRAVKPPVAPPGPPPESPREIQRRITSGENEGKINVRLLIDGSDADGIRHFDEQLPVSIVRAILDPSVADFFIPIQGAGRMKPNIVRSHWLHTSYIREVLIMGEFELFPGESDA